MTVWFQSTWLRADFCGGGGTRGCEHLVFPGEGRGPDGSQDWAPAFAGAQLSELGEVYR
jgi:hypothetical protein